jgi:hypothetical protein
MSELSDRAQANIDVVLDEVCNELPHGGDHESRKLVAEQLLVCARSGKISLNELTYMGRRALTQMKRRARPPAT